MFPDPSLTPENLSTVLDSMSDERWKGFGAYANIPRSERDRIERRYSSEKEKKQAIIHSLTSTHPALSWTRIAHALYNIADTSNDESCLRALDRLQQLFPIGIHVGIHFYMYTMMCMLHVHCMYFVYNYVADVVYMYIHVHTCIVLYEYTSLPVQEGIAPNRSTNRR